MGSPPFDASYTSSDAFLAYTIVTLVVTPISALASLKNWNALQTYDIENTIHVSSQLQRKSRAQGFRETVSIISLCCLEVWTVWATFNDYASGVHNGVSLIVTALTSIGLYSAISTVSSKRSISRIHDTSEGSFSFSINAERSQWKREVAAIILAAGGAIYQVIVQSASDSNHHAHSMPLAFFILCISGLLYRWVSAPFFPALRNGRVSVQGIVYICLGIFASILVALFLHVTLYAPWVKENEILHPITAEERIARDAIHLEYVSLNKWIVNLFGVPSAALIALILRYEYTQSVGNAAPSERVTKGVRSHKGEFEKSVETPRISQAGVPKDVTFSIPVPRGFSVKNLNLHQLPVTGSMIITQLAFNVLYSPLFRHGLNYLEEQTTNALVLRIVSVITFAMFRLQPQIIMLLFAPLIVIIASRTRADGRKMWEYVEGWNLPVKRNIEGA